MVKPAKIDVSNFDHGQHIFRRSMDLLAFFGQNIHKHCFEKLPPGSDYWKLPVSNAAQNT